jgi:phage regulator Rha-like protein
MTVDLIVANERIASFIMPIRGRKVMLDSDLAELYGVTTKRLNEQVRRNIDRFPQDFMFQLNEKETDDMRSQIATASKRNIRYLPYAFTEHGVIMVASVLNTRRAIEVSVYVVRVFVRLREMFAANKELARKLAELEHKVGEHDETISSLIAAIRQLMAEPAPSRREIGFKTVGK